MSKESVLNTGKAYFFSMASERELRVRLAKVGHLLHREGLTSGTSGNISVRLPERNLCLIKPSGYHLADLNPEDFLILNIETRKKLGGKGNPRTETPFHTHLYNIREDADSIVHVHAHYTTVLSLFNLKIKPYTTNICETPGLTRGISTAEFALPGTEELAQNLGKALHGFDAAVMPHHGITTVGETPENAALKAVVVERMAKIQYHALLLGEPDKIPDQLVEHLKNLKK